VGYISHDNPDAAIDTILEIIRRVEILTEHPGMGRPGRVEGTREQSSAACRTWFPTSTKATPSSFFAFFTER
jgi:plasmid stabilization system protein ParE